MIRWIILLVVIVFSLGLQGQNQVCADEEWAFDTGERIVYKVYYNWGFVWVPAGEVVFEVKDQWDSILLSITGKSYSSYDPIFKVRDYYRSEIDKQTKKPNYFMRQVQEGDYIRYDSISYNKYQLPIEYYRGKTRESATMKKHKLKSCLFDLVTACYFLRNQKRTSILEDLNLDILYDNKEYNIDINYVGTEDKHVRNIGKVPSIDVTPELVAGTVFKEGDVMHIWVSDDQNKIPVLIESPIYIGSIKAVLKSYENLKYESVIPINEK